MALGFAALTTVIADLDHPQRGMIKVGQQAMITLQNSMNRDIKYFTLTVLICCFPITDLVH
jgi:hypothetical protein